LINKDWINRQTTTPESHQLYEQERLVLWTAERVSKTMEKTSTSAADLARMLETSHANVTELLSGDHEMTLRTLAKVAYMLGQRVVISLEPLHEPAESAATPHPEG
jgi:ribosome-binding protein aMBF1 (putative translation factor)